MASTPSRRRSNWPEPAWAGNLADLLRRCPGELASGPVQPTPFGWFDADRAAELAAVHRFMLQAGYRTDPQRHARADYWVIDAAGDCEDKALWCHRRLAALGWPKSAMRLWTCCVRQGGHWCVHAVLVISLTLSDGSVVEVALDCRQSTPMRRSDLGYRLWRIIDPVGAQKSAETGAAGQD